ncbi:MAG: MBL fold metallo-hydrolase [Clostridiales bacterium]|nr:MBL fold metallo-hydrolase [Clostridiales bacterium]
MEKLYVLGTGNASVTKCFNTCFVLQDEEGKYFMVDGGGGNGILTKLEKMQIPTKDIHELFVTHKHTDHLLGIIWIIRTIGQQMRNGKYEGNLNIYCHNELVDIIYKLCEMTLVEKLMKLFGERIILHEVMDREERDILHYHVKFFDIQSTKAKQFGFVTTLNNGKRLTFCGDEPYQEHCFDYAYRTDYLLHEAFCLYEQRDRFKPYEKCHSTVKDAAELATKLEVKNLLLWYTEDDNIRKRKSLYKKEARKYYKGNLYIPYDKEIIELD